MGDGGTGDALQGDRGPAGARGLKGNSGDKVEVHLENVVLKDLNVHLERLVKWDLLEAKVELGHMVKKVKRETLAVLANKDLYVHEVVQVQGVQGAKGLSGIVGIQDTLRVQ